MFAQSLDVVSPVHHQIQSVVDDDAIQLEEVLHVFLQYCDGIYFSHIVLAIVDVVLSANVEVTVDVNP